MNQGDQAARGPHVVHGNQLTFVEYARVLSECRLALTRKTTLRFRNARIHVANYVRSRLAFCSRWTSPGKLNADMAYTTALAQWTGSQVCGTIMLVCSVQVPAQYHSAVRVLQCVHSSRQPSRPQPHKVSRNVVQTNYRNAKLRQHVTHATGTEVLAFDLPIVLDSLPL